jgi:FkbM family methyltransferase
MNKKLIQLLKPMVERFPYLSIAYRNLRDKRQLNVKSQMSSMGFLFVGDQSMQIGQFEPEETQIVKNMLPNVDVVINVGANIGYYCCIALSQNKYVIAFEPININLQYLFRNIKTNNFDSQIEIFPIALSDKVGIIDIFGSGTGASLINGWAGNPKESVTLVPCSTLDIILNTRFQNKKCLIIVDIEGAELLMLKGSSYFLDMEPKPIWLMEISITEHQPKGIRINPNLLTTFEIFWNRNYEAWTADKECRSINLEEIKEIVSTGQDTIHTHNFLFIDKEQKIIQGNG